MEFFKKKKKLCIVPIYWSFKHVFFFCINKCIYMGARTQAVQLNKLSYSGHINTKTLFLSLFPFIPSKFQ